MNEHDTPVLDYTGASILGNGELAAKTFGTWLPGPVESVREHGVWVHRQVAQRPAAPTYVLDRALCPRCANEGTLKHEGKYEGCPDCPRGREVNRQLAEIEARQDDGNEPPRFCVKHGVDLWSEDEKCEYCEAERNE